MGKLPAGLRVILIDLMGRNRKKCFLLIKVCLHYGVYGGSMGVYGQKVAIFCFGVGKVRYNYSSKQKLYNSD